MVKPAWSLSLKRALEKRHPRRIAVARDDDLGAGGHEAVEGVKKLLGRLGLAFEELEVVEKQGVVAPVGVLEGVDLVVLQSAA